MSEKSMASETRALAIVTGASSSMKSLMTASPSPA
jgi:hypothetical protein